MSRVWIEGASREELDLERDLMALYLMVANGLDGDEHARFRALVDRYFTPAAMAEFAPACRAVARALVDRLPRDRPFDAVGDLGAPFAVRAQAAWLYAQMVRWGQVSHTPENAAKAAAITCSRGALTHGKIIRSWLDAPQCIDSPGHVVPRRGRRQPSRGYAVAAGAGER